MSQGFGRQGCLVCTRSKALRYIVLRVKHVFDTNMQTSDRLSAFTVVALGVAAFSQTRLALAGRLSRNLSQL